MYPVLIPNRAWYGSRIVDFLVPEVDYLFYLPKKTHDQPSIFSDFLSLTKINRTGTFIASLIGGIGYASDFSAASLPIIAFGAIVIILMYVSIAILNDIVDVEGDKLNDPVKPIARGALSVKTASLMFAGVFIAGLITAFSFSIAIGAFFLIEFAMGLIYCYKAKQNGIFSYMLMGCTHIAFPFLAGNILMGNFNETILLIAAYAWVTMFLGISVKDFKDIEGDRATGVKTFPIIYGVKTAYKLTTFGFLLAPISFLIPWYFLGLSTWFLALYGLVAIWKVAKSKLMLTYPDPKYAVKILNQFRFAVMGEMLAWGVATI